MLATWPPLEVAERSGWVLGANGGFTGRANSLTVVESDAAVPVLVLSLRPIKDFEESLGCWLVTRKAA